MSRTGRELTLFSIYGLPGGSRRATAVKGTAVLPTRPTAPASAGSLRAPSRSASLRRVRPPERAAPSIGLDHRDARGDQASVGDEREEEAATRSAISSHAVACREEPSPPHSRLPSPLPLLRPKLRPRPKSSHGKADDEKGTDRFSPQAVLSLYGDGFIELAPRAMHGSGLTVPFTIQIRMFKAAHESMERSAIESEASRHVSPELNDAGEFVRWGCCGNTDKSVFGCPVASDEQVEKLTVEEHLKLRPPKLVACKLTPCKSDPSDSLRFVIFDRGYPAQFTPNEVGALNAGCRVSWQGYECWATSYDIPHDCWVDFSVTFDGQYLQIRIDDDLVDSAVVQLSSRVPSPVCRVNCVLGCHCPGTQWFSSSNANGSIFVGGYSKFSKRVNAWRVHGGFVGLIAEAKLIVGERLDGAEFRRDDKAHMDPVYYARIVATEDCEITNLETPNKLTLAVHRNVFWRRIFPPFGESSVRPSIRLLGNFYHGAHHDVSPRGQASFENLLLSTVQVGDVRIRIELSKEFMPTFGSEHGCRTQAEYDVKCSSFIRQLESWSPLLVVLVNTSDVTPCAGSFEVSLELFRSTGRFVSIALHSMMATSCFPSLKDVRAKITDIISLEARRSPGEGVIHQAFRSFLSLAEQARDNRERAFMVSVMNRKAVITEKRITDVFQRIGFHFSQSELHDLIRLFKSLQDDYHRHQHRMDDIPTMSLLSPTSTGLYHLPLIHQASINVITPSERSATRSKWQFIAILLNYDLQLLDFVQSGCPESAYGGAYYAQSRYLHGGFVDRFSIHVSDIASHVYSIIFSLRRCCADQVVPNRSSSQLQHSHDDHDPVGHSSGETNNRILVQFENGETLQQLAQFQVEPPGDCKWLSLAALYRSRKTQLWRFQALGGSSHAGSIHSGLEQMNAILVDRHIVQVYEVVVSYEISEDTPEFADFASRFAKNIRFGRNGKIHMAARTRSEIGRKNAVVPDTSASESSYARQAKLAVSLRIQGVNEEIAVYRHDGAASSIPTVQSVCRSILRTLSDHGIKESLQQNPFVAGAKKVKRSVTVRVTTEDTNTPIPSAYIFVEKSLDNQKAISNLASKIVPTLTMGSRLVSIRRRLQKKKFSEEVKIAARSFAETVINLGTRYAMVSLRDAKLVPIIKSRAMLRRVMRRRQERIKEEILKAMSESERSRMYSRNGPTRLQQLFRPTLNLTPSEKELVNEVVEMKLDTFRCELGLLNNGPTEGNDVEAVWQSHMNGDHSASALGEIQSNSFKLNPSDREDRPETEGECGGQAVKKPQRSYQTDTDGAVTCQLAPGSYSLYVFHADYFEWTSLAVIFPTVNASGMYGGSLSTSAPQEIVVPLETFKWSYAIQLVDFYHEHIHKHIAGVPIVITDKVTSEETIVHSRPDGSVTWDVRKGIYAVRVPTEGTSIVYSGSKNVVVDGGRYHPPRTIFIPILVGKLAVDLTVGTGLRLDECTIDNGTARIQIIPESNRDRFARSLLPADLTAHSADDVSKGVEAHIHPVNSTYQFQIRPGRYALAVTANGCFPYSTMLHVPWNANNTDGCRELAVLCPVFCGSSTYRAIFSCVNGTGVLDAMVEVVEPQATKRTYWRRGPCIGCDDVIVHDTWILDSCEYQTFTIACLPDRSYRLRVAIRADARSQLQKLRPRVHVYDESGLAVDIVLQHGINWHGEFYWNPCKWNTQGELVAHSESPMRVEE